MLPDVVIVPPVEAVETPVEPSVGNAIMTTPSPPLPLDTVPPGHPPPPPPRLAVPAVPLVPVPPVPPNAPTPNVVQFLPPTAIIAEELNFVNEIKV